MIASTIASAAFASLLSAQSTALDEGVKLFREGRFDEALVKLEEAHRIAPRDATIENLLGITETKIGHVEEADNHYRSAIRLNPSQAAPHRNLGFNLLTAKDYVHADSELREASRLDPNDNFAHYYLLLLALATNHDSEALMQASHASKLVDNDPDAGAGLIEADIRLDRVDDAISRIDHLEEASGPTSTQEYQIGILFTQHERYTQAVRCFRRIAKLDPSWQNRYNLALALLNDGQSAEASTLLAALHSDQPRNADILVFLGSAFEAQQKMSEALEAYRDALLADPSNPDRTLDYTRLLMDMDRYDEAIQVVQTGIGETSSTAPLQLRLGAVEMVKGNYDAARNAFRAALATDPQLDAAYVGLAQGSVALTGLA
jgi:superkiller protein 3